MGPRAQRFAHELIAFAVLDALAFAFLVGFLGGFALMLGASPAGLLEPDALRNLVLASTLAAFGGLVRARDPARPPPRGKLLRKLLRTPASAPAPAAPLALAMVAPPSRP